MNSENITVSIERPSECEIKASVKIAQAEIKTILDAALKEFQKMATVPGFRKGKAPKAMVLKAYKANIIEEVKERATRTGYTAIFQTEDVQQPAGYPAMKQGDFSLESDFEFTISYETEPEFELGDYKSITIERPEVSVEEAELEAALADIAERQKKIEKSETEPAKLGDMIKASYTGTIEGEVEESAQRILKSEESWLMLNDPEMIPGIKESLVGAKAGDTVVDTVNFPADFHEASLAGKSAEYTFDVIEVHTSVLPEINDDFAKEIGLESLADLNEKIEENLLQGKKQEVEGKIQEEALKQLLALAGDFPVPPSQITEEVNSLKADKANAELTDEEVTAKAKERVQSFYLLVKLAKEEKIQVSQSDMDEQIQKMSYYSQKSPKLVQKKLEKEGRMNSIALDISLNKTVERLVELATGGAKTEEA